VITAFVQVRCSRDLISETAEAIAEVDGVSEVYSISGDWDLLALVRVRTYDDIAKVVTQHLVKVPGIIRTHTISAFRVYAKRDREAGFTLGEH
jgi:DNA-binding Lrp family transcriptional regulator